MHVGGSGFKSHTTFPAYQHSCSSCLRFRDRNRLSNTLYNRLVYSTAVGWLLAKTSRISHLMCCLCRGQRAYHAAAAADTQIDCFDSQSSLTPVWAFSELPGTSKAGCFEIRNTVCELGVLCDSDVQRVAAERTRANISVRNKILVWSVDRLDMRWLMDGRKVHMLAPSWPNTTYKTEATAVEEVSNS